MVSNRILVFEAYPVFSGAQRVSLNLCKALKEEKKEITLLLADDSNGSISSNFKEYVDNIILLNTSKTLLRYGNSEKWFSIFNFIYSILFGLIPFYLQCFKVLRKGKFDALYFCDPRGAVMILLPSVFFRMKKIMYLQSKNKLGAMLSKFLFLTFTDFVICPSTDVLKSLPPSDKKKVINYGIDFSQYTNVDKDILSDEIIKIVPESLMNRRRLLFAGLIKPQKGVHHLIYSLKDLKDSIALEDFPITFILGGAKTPAEINYQKSLFEYCEKSGLSEYVFWLGWRDDVLVWMKNVNYFVFPTINREHCEFEGFDSIIESTEGSPVVLIESSLCQTFTVAARVTGVTDTISEGVNGITYNPDNSLELTNALKFLMKNNPKFEDFPNRELFSPNTFKHKFLEIINNK